MSDNSEFVLTYVLIPLVIAVGWLLWRLRDTLRRVFLYALAVASLVAFVRVALVAWHAGEAAFRAGMSPPAFSCLDRRGEPMSGKDRSGCWM